jgi:hypothetical protein
VIGKFLLLEEFGIGFEVLNMDVVGLPFHFQAIENRLFLLLQTFKVTLITFLVGGGRNWVGFELFL